VLEPVLTITALVVIGFPLLVYLAQDSLVFHPQPIAEAQRAALAQRPAVESLFIDAADGTRLHAWHARGKSADTLVMYFGGNAEEVSWMLDDAARRTPDAGWLLVDYRGYGASQGSPRRRPLRRMPCGGTTGCPGSTKPLMYSDAASAAAWRCNSPRSARSPAWCWSRRSTAWSKWASATIRSSR
jgi:hypothetical protein